LVWILQKHSFGLDIQSSETYPWFGFGFRVLVVRSNIYELFKDLDNALQYYSSIIVLCSLNACLTLVMI